MENISYLSRWPLFCSDLSCGLISLIDEDQTVHLLWAYPLNGVVSLAGIVLQPLVSLINMIAAAIFKLISLCSSEKEWSQEATINFLVGVKSLTSIATLLMRIFYPAFEAL